MFQYKPREKQESALSRALGVAGNILGPVGTAVSFLPIPGAQAVGAGMMAAGGASKIGQAATSRKMSGADKVAGMAQGAASVAGGAGNMASDAMKRSLDIKQIDDAINALPQLEMPMQQQFGPKLFEAAKFIRGKR